jgi:peptidoglycan hydrolase-like protein with peptidoglycan-binding domain
MAAVCLEFAGGRAAKNEETRMKYGSISAITAALFAAAIAVPTLAQTSGQPIPGNAPPRENTNNSTNQPQSMKDRPTTSGGMTTGQATGGRVTSPSDRAPSVTGTAPGSPSATAPSAGSMSGSSSGMSSTSPSRDPMSSDGRALGKSKAAAKMGDQSVKAAQEALNRNGANITADGKMGPKTKAAIREYQQKNGLQATGNLDSQTKARLGVS